MENEKNYKMVVRETNYVKQNKKWMVNKELPTPTMIYAFASLEEATGAIKRMADKALANVDYEVKREFTYDENPDIRTWEAVWEYNGNHYRRVYVITREVDKPKIYQVTRK